MFVSLRSGLVRFFQLTTLLLVSLAAASVALGQAQSNAADLQGTVKDASSAVVPNATVTARNPATNVSRNATTNEDGLYRLINLPPGTYEVTVEAPNFKKAFMPNVNVTVGQTAQLDVNLELGEISETVTISDATSEVVETNKTAVATTIDQQRINNLPINERNYLSFALTTSTVGRDNGRPIGPAPTTGLNFGGQRGRSNLVQVDGADNTDNSVNASRSTVSQEAVQEFQVVTNSFAPEFGRSAGGVVNVVTKSGYKRSSRQHVRLPASPQFPGAQRFRAGRGSAVHASAVRFHDRRSAGSRSHVLLLRFRTTPAQRVGFLYEQRRARD
jgi:hypothetical protein